MHHPLRPSFPKPSPISVVLCRKMVLARDMPSLRVSLKVRHCHPMVLQQLALVEARVFVLCKQLARQADVGLSEEEYSKQLDE